MEEPRMTHFDHEKLAVYQEAIAFVAWLSNIMASVSKVGEIKDCSVSGQMAHQLR
jgi:hypothetical protein